MLPEDATQGQVPNPFTGAGGVEIPARGVQLPLEESPAQQSQRANRLLENSARGVPHALPPGERRLQQLEVIAYLLAELRSHAHKISLLPGFDSAVLDTVIAATSSSVALLRAEGTRVEDASIAAIRRHTREQRKYVEKLHG